MAGSFSLCVATGRGFQVKYVSSDFEELFGVGCSSGDNVQCTSRALFAGTAHLRGSGSDPHPKAFASAASSAGVPLEQAQRGVELLAGCVVSEEERVFSAEALEQEGGCQAGTGAFPLRRCAFALALAHRKGGELFVCEVIALAREHPVLGWRYGATFHRDISSSVSVTDLLTAAVNGTYTTILAKHQSSFFQRCATIQRASVTECLDAKAGEMFQAFVASGLTSTEPNKQGKKRSADVCSLASRSTTATGMSILSSGSVATDVPAAETAGVDAGSQRHAQQGTHIQFLSCDTLEEVDEQRDEELAGSKQEHADRYTPPRDFADLLEPVEEEDEEDPQANSPASSGFESLAAVAFAQAAKTARPTNTVRVPSKRAPRDTVFAAAQGRRKELYSIWQSLLAPKSYDLCQAMDAIWSKVLSDLDFALTLSDPCQPGCPMVLCSAGFTDLTGYRAHEVIGQDTPMFLRKGVPRDLVNTTWHMELCKLFIAAAKKMPYKVTDSLIVEEEPTGPVSGGKLSQAATATAVDGELIYVQTSARKCGSLFKNMQYWKHVSLDDKDFVLGLYDPLTDPQENCQDFPVERIRDRCQLVLRQLNERMNLAEQVLSSQFWYQAGMRRQVAVYNESAI